MKTVTRLISVAAVAAAAVAGGALLLRNGGAPDAPRTADAAYRWMLAQQAPSGLLRSNEELELCFLYDQALAAILYAARGDLDRARRTLDLFAADLEGQRRQGGFVGFADAYRENGAVGDPSRSGGPTAWLLLAVNRYAAASGDTRYQDLGRTVADWLLECQGREGGIVGGYDRWREPMSWVSTEHNLDAYAALRDFARATGDRRYAEAAWRIRGWLLWDPWVEDEARFANGRADANYASDVASWAVCALGPSFAPGLAYAERVALCRHRYAPLGVEVEGFDFGASYRDGPLPDRDAVWFEGTGQFALAYRLAGDDAKADFFVGQLEACLTPSAAHPGTSGLPYASNPGTPPYGTWTMPDRPPCVSSTAWYLFAKWRINPFSADDRAVEADSWLAQEARRNGWADRPRILPALDSFEEASALRLLSSYPRRLAFGDSAAMTIRPETSAAAVGAASARIDFVPERPGGWALAERTFGRCEDASAYDRLAARIHGDASGHLLAFQLRDRDREVWTTQPIRLDFSGWRAVAIDLDRATIRSPFDRVADGNGRRDPEALAGFLVVLAAVSDDPATLYLDDVRLLRRGEAGPPATALAAWTDSGGAAGARKPVADFERHPNDLGGGVGAYGAAAALDGGAPISNYYTPKTPGYDPSNVRSGRASFRVAWRDDRDERWASCGIGLRPETGPAFDARGHRALVLWVRGAAGTRFDLVLKEAGAPEGKGEARFVPFPGGLPGGGWVRAEVPLAQVAGSVDLRRLGSVVVDVTPSVARPGFLFLDDVVLER